MTSRRSASDRSRRWSAGVSGPRSKGWSTLDEGIDPTDVEDFESGGSWGNADRSWGGEGRRWAEEEEGKGDGRSEDLDDPEKEEPKEGKAGLYPPEGDPDDPKEEELKEGKPELYPPEGAS